MKSVLFSVSLLFLILPSISHAQEKTIVLPIISEMLPISDDNYISSEDEEKTVMLKGSRGMINSSHATIVFQEGSIGDITGEDNVLYVSRGASVSVRGKNNTVYSEEKSQVNEAGEGTKIIKVEKFSVNPKELVQ